MDITTYFNLSQISLKSEIDDREELFAFMLDSILAEPIFPFARDIREDALNILIEREKHTASNMGNGIFVPHARIEGISNPAISILTLNDNAKKQWLDKYGCEVNVFVMLIIPKDKPTLGLNMIAGIAQMFENTELLPQIVKAISPKEIYSKMQSIALSDNKSLRLRNIMNREIESLSPDTKLSEAVRIMHIKRYHAMPVVSDCGNVVGEVNSDMLLSHGIPDFFKNLSTVSFIREFDPLEKYFTNEANLKCEDCMNQTPCCMSKDSTILECIFELSIKGHQRVYVVDEGKLIGAVDRSTVLDKLLNI